MGIIVGILLLLIGVIALFLGIHASLEAEYSFKWSIVSIACGLYVSLGLIIALAIGKADSSAGLEVLIFIIPAIAEICFGLKGVCKWSMEKEEKTKQLLIDKKNTFTEKKRDLVSEIKKLRLEQQKILSRWTSSPYGSESECAEQSRK